MTLGLQKGGPPGHRETEEPRASPKGRAGTQGQECLMAFGCRAPDTTWESDVFGCLQWPGCWPPAPSPPWPLLSWPLPHGALGKCSIDRHLHPLHTVRWEAPRLHRDPSHQGTATYTPDHTHTHTHTRTHVLPHILCQYFKTAIKAAIQTPPLHTDSKPYTPSPTHNDPAYPPHPHSSSKFAPINSSRPFQAKEQS